MCIFGRSLVRTIYWTYKHLVCGMCDLVVFGVFDITTLWEKQLVQWCKWCGTDVLYTSEKALISACLPMLVIYSYIFTDECVFALCILVCGTTGIHTCYRPIICTYVLHMYWYAWNGVFVFVYIRDTNLSMLCMWYIRMYVCRSIHQSEIL